MAQLMLLPLTVSCFSKIQTGLPFWYRPTQVVLDKWLLNGRVCVILQRTIAQSLLLGISMTKSLGTFCRFGSCMVTRPVAVKVSTSQCMRSIASTEQLVLTRCSGNTTFDSAAVSRRHSRMTPGSGWSGRSLSRTSFAVLQTGFARLEKSNVKMLETLWLECFATKFH